MATTYPIGYGNDRVSLAELRNRHEPRMVPEYAERLFAWIESMDGLIGIGGGWRAVQPEKPGFAPPGQSFHESQTFADGTVGYCAVDLVATSSAGRHRSPTWAEVMPQGSDAARRWGLHCNVGAPPRGEPWHMQPIEIDGWLRWQDAGRPLPKPGYPFPGRTDGGNEPVRPPRPAGFFPGRDEWAPFVNDADWSGYPKVGPTTRSRHAWLVEGMLRHVIFPTADPAPVVDGIMGSTSAGLVRFMQQIVGLEVDGWVGPQTWRYLRGRLTEHLADSDDGTTALKWGRWYVDEGDSLWRIAARVYGAGADWPRIDQANGGDGKEPPIAIHPGQRLKIPGAPGRQTKVDAGEGAWAILDRLGLNPQLWMPTFHAWNGGSQRTLHPGDPVFVPNDRVR